MDKKSAKNLAVGVAVGAIAGAIAGILFAPKSGKETRADISKYLHEMKEKIAEELAKAGKISKEKYDEVVSKVVKIYEAEKKITKKDAVDIGNKLKKNYAVVAKIAGESTKK
ncbi:MAG: YtxH domain-containing protein [Candidatus Berkelbacteria bacterium]|nr:YtxH domain-containing protein [Candidatus Berkelbacteria bacterium]